jgi:hypothetical protein
MLINNVINFIISFIEIWNEDLRIITIEKIYPISQKYDINLIDIWIKSTKENLKILTSA